MLKYIWGCLVLVALMTGCATTTKESEPHGYLTWTGIKWVLVNPYDYFYRGEDGAVYHCDHFQRDMIVVFDPSQPILPAKPKIPAEYYKKKRGYYEQQ